MNNALKKIILLLSENKRFLIPLIPLILFILLFIFVVSLSFLSPDSPSQNGQGFPTPTQAKENPPTPTQIVDQEDQDISSAEADEDQPIILYEESAELEKKETLPDGSIKYSFTTKRAGRPDIVITTGEDQATLFERTVSSPEDLPQFSDYLAAYGQPERIISGSQFYGPSARIYIYAQSQGITFIVSGSSVVEVHTFAPMNIDEYLAKYGNQI